MFTSLFFGDGKMTTLAKQAQWFEAIPAFIAAGGPNGKRWLKQFRIFCEENGFGWVDEGFGVAYALDECILAWQTATHEERATAIDHDSFKALRMAFRAGTLTSQRAEAENRNNVRLARAAKIRAATDDSRFTLIAGEHSRVIAHGTLDECKSSLDKVVNEPVDGYVHKGCWVIVHPELNEVGRGEFNRHGLLAVSFDD